MHRLLATLHSRWVLTGIGAATAGLTVWVFGSFLGTLDEVVPRTLALALIAGVWASTNALIDQGKRRADAHLAKGVAQGGAAGSADLDAAAGREDVEELRARLQRAMALLRRTRGRRGYLYEQPWYVIIGPPGAGKTTALANSGLAFPLEAELGHGEIKGVGGTSLCEWIFTDQAVLIDTAGRFTTQDSSAAVDRTGWEGFLDLLRRTRPRQPLNGVLVAIGLDDIIGASEDERRSTARAIRARVKELTGKIGLRLPVYVIFTKSDLLRGFAEFFGDLDRPRRAQVWGVTFPAEIDEIGPTASFADEFRAMVAQVSARVIDRLHDERMLERRTLIASFPTQMASLEAPLVAFIEEAFSGTRLAPSAWLRGVYFTSATQQGSPLDRLTAVLARGFGLDPQRVTPAGGARGRSYFLEDLLKDVIFGEAMLVARNSRAGRRYALLRLGVWAGTGAVVALGLAWIGLSAWHGAGAIERLEQSVGAYQAAYRELARSQTLDPVPLGASDLESVLPALDRARELAAAREAGGLLGLSPAEELRQTRTAVYRRALGCLLQPRLVSLMEARMRAEKGDIGYMFLATRLYHMLSGRDPANGGEIHDWLNRELAGLMGGGTQQGVRERLLAHTDALFHPARPGEPVSVIPEDFHLVESAEAVIGKLTIGEQVYVELRAGPMPPELRDFIPARSAGALGRQYFLRLSGASLDVPVPGFFTPDGFRLVLKPRLSASTDRAIAQSRVRGQAGAVNPNDTRGRQKIERDVIAAYTKEYIETWQHLLDDLQVVVPPDSATAGGQYAELTSPTGPMGKLLAGIAANLAVTDPPKPGEPPVNPAFSGAAIDEKFRDLREYITDGSLTRHLQSLGAVQQQIDQAVSSEAAGAAPSLPALSAADTLAGQVRGAPEPAHRWLVMLANRGRDVRNATEHEHAARAFAGPGGAAEQCRRVVQLYPFRSTAEREVSLDEFAALFAPNGALDGYFTRYMRPFVTTSTTSKWRAHDAGGVAAPLTDVAASAFQRAVAIRDAFFGFGGTIPQARFNIRAVSLSPGTQSATLDIGGNSVTYKATSPGTAANFDWPGPTGDTSAGVTFDPPGDGPPIEWSGTWAMFRLVGAGAPEAAGGGGRALRLTYTQGSQQVIFMLNAWPNPFRPELLAGFNCPNSLRG